MYNPISFYIFEFKGKLNDPFIYPQEFALYASFQQNKKERTCHFPFGVYATLPYIYLSIYTHIINIYNVVTGTNGTPKSVI